ncbi:MAG: hypothetical protein IKZ73_02130 [Lachnospiraceae bacterium]|nr:hypothetical protein [Lachnospiraceae bacterium]
MEKRDRLICFFLFTACFGTGLITALKLNIPPVLDEVGILANSAYAAGYDWSETTYTMGGFYYKYGISLLYAPFLKAIDDPYILYKVLLSINVFLYAFVPVIAYTIQKKHLQMKRLVAVLFAIIVGAIPCCFIFQLYAKADSMLIVLPWVVLYLVMELSGTNSGRKKTVLSILLAAVSMYSYMVHTRGVVIIIALILTIVLAGVLNKKCVINIPAFLVTAAILLVVDKWLSGLFYDGVYGAYGTAHASAESFEFSELKKIFTLPGLKTLGRLIIGWLFTGMTATSGLLGVGVLGGIIFGIKEFWIKIFKKKTVEIEKETESVRPSERILSIYSVLSMLGVFAMGILFFFPPVYKYLNVEAVVRSDRLIYERYMAAAFGPLVLYGLYLLYRGSTNIGQKAKRAVLIISGAAFAGIIALFMFECVEYIEGVQGNSRYIIGLSMFLKVSGGSTNAIFPDMSQSLLKAGLLGFGLYILLAVLSEVKADKKSAGKLILLAGTALAAMYVTLILVSFNNIRLSRDEALYSWTSEPAGYMLNLPSEFSEYPVFWDYSAKDIKHYQFQLKQYRIGSYCTKTKKADNCFVIVQKGHFLKEYYNDDYYIFDDFNYENATRDIVYVKGSKLAKQLEEKGYGMTKYEGKLKKAKYPELESQIMPYLEPDVKR